jgi:hypothetical protein
MLAFDGNGEAALIVLLNGAFGIGKTTVARTLVPRLPRCVLFDPEPIGILLQRLARMAGRNVDDFQDLRLWRRLTIATLRLLRLFSPNIVVPMAFSNPVYLDEILIALRRFEPTLHHFCLIAPLAVVHARQRERRPRGEDAAWQLRRAAECCAVHPQPQFAVHIDAGARTPEEIAEEILAALH